MGSYIISAFMILLCVFWLSHDSLKVACKSREDTASVLSAVRVKRGRSGGERPTEGDVIAMKAAAKKALDAGKGPGEKCDKTLLQLDLSKFPTSIVGMVKVSVKEVLEESLMSKELVLTLTNKVREVGGMLCAVKNHLVCVDGSCKGCGDLTANEKSHDTIKDTCAAADMIEPNAGGNIKGCSSLLAWVGLTCVCIGILHPLLFM